MKHKTETETQTKNRWSNFHSSLQLWLQTWKWLERCLHDTHAVVTLHIPVCASYGITIIICSNTRICGIVKTKHNKTGVNLYQREVPTSSMKTSTPLAMENLGPLLSDGWKNKVENITIVILSSYFQLQKYPYPFLPWAISFMTLAFAILPYWQLQLKEIGKTLYSQVPLFGWFFL